MPLSCEQVKTSSGMTSFLTTARMLLPRLSNSCINFRISPFGFAAHIQACCRCLPKSVHAHFQTQMSWGCDLVFLCFVLLRFQITEDCMRVGSCLLFGSIVSFDHCNPISQRPGRRPLGALLFVPLLQESNSLVFDCDWLWLIILFGCCLENSSGSNTVVLEHSLL